MASIVFLHGLAGSRHQFDYIADKFPNAVVFDLPGFGDAVNTLPKHSSELCYSSELYVEWLRGKIQKPSMIVGYSMGAIIAKDFALRYPELVTKLLLIAYPLQRDTLSLRRTFFGASWLNRLYIDKSWLAKFMCKTICEPGIVPRFFIYPFARIFTHKYFLVVSDYFRHTYRSVSSAMHDTLLKDDPQTLRKVKAKIVLIMGDKDRYVDHSLVNDFRHHIIKNMDHLMFDHEKEIVEALKKEL